ncbi:unannotated protein [freshwater metagenome]|uniref:Unannotated protein n=1 Tax=freshwater metagenome TaxID=449393 RepID=A0A6J7S9Z8_9ZZZZ
MLLILPWTKIAWTALTLLAPPWVLFRAEPVVVEAALMNRRSPGSWIPVGTAPAPVSTWNHWGISPYFGVFVVVYEHVPLAPVRLPSVSVVSIAHSPAPLVLATYSSTKVLACVAGMR